MNYLSPPRSARCGPEVLWLTRLSKAMHAGVIRDIEQQRVKKERQADFEMQKALEEEYRKVQNVDDGSGNETKAAETG